MIRVAVSFDASNLIKATKDLENKQIPQEIHKALVKKFREIKIRAQQKHRFKSRTGNLVNSIRTETKKAEGTIYIDELIAPYGVYVHEGHGHTVRKWRPDRFLRNAILYKRKEIIEDLKRAVSKAIRKSGFR